MSASSAYNDLWVLICLYNTMCHRTHFFHHLLLFGILIFPAMEFYLRLRVLLLGLRFWVLHFGRWRLDVIVYSPETLAILRRLIRLVLFSGTTQTSFSFYGTLKLLDSSSIFPLNGFKESSPFLTEIFHFSFHVLNFKSIFSYCRKLSLILFLKSFGWCVILLTFKITLLLQ